MAAVICVLATQAVFAQKGKKEVEGTSYFLPRTALRFAVKVEKSIYKPGELSAYADKYLKIKDVSDKPSTTYRLVDFKIKSEGLRDTSKMYVAPTDAKHNIDLVNLDDNAVLLSLNAEPRPLAKTEPFRPAVKAAPLNPREYMNEDMLSAGSLAKLAELCALEIYDIRDSKSLLSKGQAEFMPKDGEQLRIMLNNLNTQEAALMQLFVGVTEVDTTEHIVSYIPEKTDSRDLLFRFSKWSGLTDPDDLSGNPYYIGVEDLHVMPAVQESFIAEKPAKGNCGIFVNMPGKIKVSLYKGATPWMAYELYAAQFGRVVELHPDLFGQKMFTSLVVNPVTGNLENLQTEYVKK